MLAKSVPASGAEKKMYEYLQNVEIFIKQAKHESKFSIYHSFDQGLNLNK